MKYILFLFLSFFIIVNLGAQNFTIEGRITDSETGNPVEFANIGVENTYIGTASDLNGKFEIVLSHALKDKKIRVSAVGFQTKSFSVEEWLNNEFIYVQLTPVYYGINEVSVEAKSRIGYGIIKTATNLIPENYPSLPFTYKCYIRTFNQEQSDKEPVKNEAIFLMSDSQGYTTRNFTDAFKSRNYKIVENNGKEKPSGFKGGLTMIDNLINMDIVRCPGNILSAATYHDYDVDITGKDVLNGDSVWVMNYKCKLPDILNCGDPEAISVNGTIWITMKNNVILKNKVTVVRNGYFMHGNSFYEPKQNESEKKVEYTVETNYKRTDGTYILDTIDYLQKELDKQQYTYKVYLKILDKESLDQSIINRQYYNNTTVNSDFWKEFTME